jgi:hypothetical protein
LTAVSREVDGTAAAGLAGTPALTGLVAGDDVSLGGNAAGSFADATAGVGKAVTVSGLGLVGDDAENYRLEPVTLSADLVEPGGGVAVTAYGWTGSSPPAMAATGEFLSTGIAGRIHYNWGGGDVLTSGRPDRVLLKFEGYLTSPLVGGVQFRGGSDDGIEFRLDGQVVFTDWNDHSARYSAEGIASFGAGEKRPFELWFYENGGAALCFLEWNLGNGWEPVPATAFSRVAPPGAPRMPWRSLTASLFADNDFAIFAGPESGPTRLAYQNGYQWSQQVGRQAWFYL